MAKAKTEESPVPKQVPQEETKGVLLMAFGKPAYAKMAMNMAASIKYHAPHIHITLVHDGVATCLPDWAWRFFDAQQSIHKEHLYDNIGTKEEKMNPGKAKVNIYKYLPYDHTLYLDADGAALKSVDALMATCIASGSPYLTQVVGWHSIDKGRDFKEMQWAWADNIWEHYALAADAIMPAINSSFAYIRKGPEAEAFYNQIEKNLENPIPLDKLRMPWGGSQPDELYTNIALAQTGIKCDIGYHPVYFNITIERNWQHVNDNYDILGIFGGVGFTHASVLQYYDRLMHKYMKGYGIQHEAKSHLLMKDKHANKRVPMA